MSKKVKYDPRYMKYNTTEVEALLDKVNEPDTAPTKGSDGLITSGAVKNALEDCTAFEENDDPMSLFEEDNSSSSSE